MWLSTIAAVVVILVTPLAGAWSDRVGRKRVLVLLALPSAALPITMFSLMASGARAQALVGALVLAAVAGAYSARSARSPRPSNSRAKAGSPASRSERPARPRSSAG